MAAWLVIYLKSPGKVEVDQSRGAVGGMMGERSSPSLVFSRLSGDLRLCFAGRSCAPKIYIIGFCSCLDSRVISIPHSPKDRSIIASKRQAKNQGFFYLFFDSAVAVCNLV